MIRQGKLSKILYSKSFMQTYKYWTRLIGIFLLQMVSLFSKIFASKNSSNSNVDSLVEDKNLNQLVFKFGAPSYKFKPKDLELKTKSGFISSENYQHYKHNPSGNKLTVEFIPIAECRLTLVYLALFRELFQFFLLFFSFLFLQIFLFTIMAFLPLPSYVPHPEILKFRGRGSLHHCPSIIPKVSILFFGMGA